MSNNNDTFVPIEIQTHAKGNSWQIGTERHTKKEILIEHFGKKSGYEYEYFEVEMRRARWLQIEKQQVIQTTFE